MYLSKGAPAYCAQSGMLRVSRCGTVYELGPRLANIWLRGRTQPVQVMPGQEQAIKRLAEAGLVAVSEEQGSLAAFRLVIGCVLCPSYHHRLRVPLRGRERRIWKWISQAGLRLTASELIRLEEQGVRPVPELLGEDGRQELTEAIYLNTSIFDGILEGEMEHSPARDETVDAILKLVRTQRLLLA